MPRTICGDCFGWVLQAAKPGDVIVHGQVTHPWTKKKSWHAWIERRGRVLDWQSNQGLGPGKKGWQRPAFLRAYAPDIKARYTLEEAQACAVRRKHAGPWKSCAISSRALR